MTEQQITWTETALAKACELALQPENSTKILRLYLDGKGCDGFYYGIAFDEALPEDHVFHEELDGFALALHIDPDTLQFVEGSSISWIDDERGQGFLVDNPKQRQFRGKFYKKKAWMEKFS